MWVVTDFAVYDIEWSLLKSRVESIHHENIEWVEIDRNRIWDTLFNKWDIVIQKYWEEWIAIYNAYNPYEAAHAIENFIHGSSEEESKDRFDTIMDALSGVVSEHLKKQTPTQEEFPQEKVSVDEYTIDLRNAK